MNRQIVALLLPLILLVACSFGYHARGSLSDVPREMRGKGFPTIAEGGGRFALVDAAGALQCDGKLLPPDQALAPGNCVGESGKGMVQCSDGREIAVRWKAITCRSFEGSGEDARGNRLFFRVDRSR